VSKKEPRDIAEYINCLSILEDQTSLLYKSISDKIEIPLIKTLLREIEIDSKKHSMLLKGVSESITHPKGGQKECSKGNETLQTTGRMLKEIAKIKRISSEDLMQLSERLKTLESDMGEEYYILVQMRTLKMMMKEINQMYNIDLGSVKGIFMNIIFDEEHHREILETIKQLTTKKEPASNAPFVKFQNPDAWRQPMPSAL
jgi:rubrerythrin